MTDMAINETIILINIIFIIAYTFYLYKVKAFHMNAEPLTHQPLFKAAIIAPIVSFFLLGTITWTGHNFKIDSDGFNTFLNISKLPLAALSLSIPLGVIVNNIHRTIQTDKQIKEAEKKNKIDGFYAHRKNTIEMFENLPFKSFNVVGKKHTLSFDNNYSIYRECYPFASTTSDNFVAESYFTDRAKNLWIYLGQQLKAPFYESERDFFRVAAALENTLDQIHSILQFKPIESDKLYEKTFFDSYANLYSFRSKFRDEFEFKDAIWTYWQAYIVIMRAIEIRADAQFITDTLLVEHYSLNDEQKLTFWNLKDTTFDRFTGIHIEHQVSKNQES